MFTRFVITLFLLLVACPGVAQKRFTGWMAGQNSFKSQPVQKEGDIPNVLLELEYDEGEAPKVLEIDLNSDNENELIIQSSNRLCGNGGCVYSIIEGREKTKIGELFGSILLFTDEYLNDFPVIHSYGNLSSTSGRYSVLAYDENRYKMVSNVLLTGEAVDTLFNRVKRNFKRLKPDN